MKFLFLFLFSLLLISANPARGKNPIPTNIDPASVPWKSLTYTAKSLLGTATAVVKLTPCQPPTPPEQFDKPSIGNREGTSRHTDPRPCLSVTSTIKPYFSANRFYQTKVWFSPENGLATRRLRLLRGRKYYLKDYIFTPVGVYRYRKKPAGSTEEMAKPELWSDTEKTFYPRPAGIAATTIISEPSLIFYYLSASGTDPGGKMTGIYVFNKKQYYRVNLKRGEPITIRVNYIAQGKTHPKVVKKGDMEVVGYRLISRPLGDNDKTVVEKFSFLGLTGDITIYFNEKSRIPIRIEGNIPFSGRVHFKLKQIIKADWK